MQRSAALGMALLVSACAASADTPCQAPCGPVAAVPAPAAPPALPRGFQPWTDATTGELTFVVGDQLQVTLPFYADENTLARVAPDGNIYIGLLGKVPAVNRTPGELQADLERRYAKYLRFPQVGVAPADLSSRLVFVGGEVANPRAITLRGPSGVLEAIYEAGGFENTANQAGVILIRRGPNNRPMMKLLDLKSFAKAGAATQNTLLQPFDIVYVPKSRIAEINLFVEQYIDKVVPFNQSFNYMLVDLSKGNGG